MKLLLQRFLNLKGYSKLISIAVLLILVIVVEVTLDLIIGDGNGNVSHPILNPILNVCYILFGLYITIWIHYNNKIPNISFKISILIFVSLFIIKRIALYSYVPFVGFYNDSIQYYLGVDQIKNGFPPSFDFIAPGYPIYLYLVFSIKDSHMFYMIVQTTLTLFSSFFLIYSLYRLTPKFSFIFVLLLAYFVNNPTFMRYETALLTECLYINLMFIVVSFIALVIRTDKHKYWFLLGVAIGLTLMVRSASIYLLGIVVILLLYQMLNHWSLKKSILLILPVLVFKLSVPVYNYYSKDLLKGTTFNSASAWLKKPTFPYLEEDQLFPEDLNQLIKVFTGKLSVNNCDLLSEDSLLAEEVEESIISFKDQKTIRSTWNPDSLHTIYYKYAHDEKVLLKCVMKNPDLSAKIDSMAATKSTVLSNLYYLVSSSLISKYPEAKYKYWTSGFYYYLFKNKAVYSGEYFFQFMLERYLIRYSADRRQNSENTRVIKSDYRLETLYQNYSDEYYESIKNREDEILKDYYKDYFTIGKKNELNYYSLEEFEENDIADYVGCSDEKGIVVVVKKDLVSTILAIDRILAGIPILNNSFILALLMLVESIIAIFILVRNRFRDSITWFILILFAIAIAQAMIVSVTVLPHLRYSFQLDFIKYFTIPCLFILMAQIPFVHDNWVALKNHLIINTRKYF